MPSLSAKDPIYERWRWQIFAITWIAYVGFNLTRKSFSVAKIGIGEGTSIGLTPAQMAWIDGAYLIAYAIGQFVWGIAGDRYGTRRVVLIGMVFCVVTGMAMGASSVAITFALLFSVQGFFQSSGWAPLLKNVSNFFSPGERGSFLGLWCTNYAIGGLVASLYIGFIGQYFGWRFAFFIPAGTLFLIAILFFFFQRDRPEDAGLPPIEVYHNEPVPVIKAGESPREEPEGSWKVIREVATNPVIILLAFVYLLFKPARYAIWFWGPQYVNFRLGTGMAESGFLTALFDLAGPFSVFFAGVLSDRLFGTRRMPVSIISLILLALLLMVLDDLPRSRWVLGAALFVLGFLTYAPEALISGIAAVDFGTKKGASTSLGLVNGFGSIGAILGGMLPGFLQRDWGWQGIFTVLAIALLLAAMLLSPKWSALPPTMDKSTA